MADGNQPMRITKVVMDGTFQRWRVPKGVSSIAIQARTAEDIQMATEENGVRTTMKSGSVWVLENFNWNQQYIWFRGTADVVVEITMLHLP